MAAIKYNKSLKPGSTIFFMCDIQEKFRSSINYFEEICVVAQRLLEASKILNIPTIVSEQYPKGLGKTVPELDVSGMKVFEKTQFSMVTEKILLEEVGFRTSVVLFGIEAHVCVSQTAMDLLLCNQYDVHIIADATSSRTQTDRMLAFESLRQAGARITTSEAVLFELLGDAKHAKFKEVQKLILTTAPYQGLTPKE